MLKSHAALVLPLVAATLALSSCSAAPDPTDTASAANDKAAGKFVACLLDAGQTAKIIDGGMVGILLPASEGDGVPGTAQMGGEGGPSSFAVMSQDADGQWLAAGDSTAYPEDGGMREAWVGCEEQVPEFTQPEPDMSGSDGDSHIVSRDDMIKVALAFAACARDNGYADFEDPDADGMISLTSDFTEDSFRALLEACSDTLDGLGIPISQESAAALDFDWMSVMGEFVDGPAGGGSGPQFHTEGK